MLEKILKELNNYFYRFREVDNFSIEDNQIAVRGKYLKGQYIRIIDSMFNDGIYKVISVQNNIITLEGLVDEDFQGAICSLAIPREILEIEKKVIEYNEKYKATGYQSESFQGYSYTMATDSTGRIATWQNVYFNDLKPYRKMFDNIGYVKEI